MSELMRSPPGDADPEPRRGPARIDSADYEYLWKDAEAVLSKWLLRARRSQRANYDAAKFFRNLGYLIGTPAVVLTTLIGAIALAAVGSKLSDATALLLGIGSIVAAVLSAIQIHFQFGQVSERHKNLGVRYGTIRRAIEEVSGVPRNDRGAPASCLETIRRELDAVANEADTVPDFIWRRTVRVLGEADGANTKPN